MADPVLVFAVGGWIALVLLSFALLGQREAKDGVAEDLDEDQADVAPGSIPGDRR